MAAYTGRDLAGELYELMAQRLPLLPPDDPLAPTLRQELPRLAEALGRPRLQAVPRVDA